MPQNQNQDENHKGFSASYHYVYTDNRLKSQKSAIRVNNKIWVCPKLARKIDLALTRGEVDATMSGVVIVDLPTNMHLYFMRAILVSL